MERVNKKHNENSFHNLRQFKGHKAFQHIPEWWSKTSDDYSAKKLNKEHRRAFSTLKVTHDSGKVLKPSKHARLRHISCTRNHPDIISSQNSKKEASIAHKTCLFQDNSDYEKDRAEPMSREEGKRAEHGYSKHYSNKEYWHELKKHNVLAD